MNFLKNIAVFHILISFLILQGCTVVGVDYQSPNVPAPDAWTVALSGDAGEGRSDLQNWWKGFNDPVLNELIDRTRKSNLTLKIASQRIAEARSVRGIAKSLLFPSAGATGAATRNRASESLFVPPPENPSNLYVAGFDAGWEIDVFGGIRRNIESADANVEASAEAYRDLLITLFAETAVNYVEYRTVEERIRFAENNIDSQGETVKLAQARLDAGLAPKIDVSQATTILRVSSSLIPLLRAQLALAGNRLATLSGGYPASLDSLLEKRGTIPVPKKEFATGMPADLIRSRPDIREVERLLAAQTARIGVAEADLYPRFTLFGDFSFQSIDTSNFADAASRAYSFGPSFRWQIFSAGRIRNSIKVQEALTEQALVAYEGKVLSAVEEVETSMAAVFNGWKRVEILTDPEEGAVRSAADTLDLVEDNYRNGLVSFQRVQDALQIKFTTEDEAAVARGAVAIANIALYKALGGGSEVKVIPISEPRTRARSSTFFGKKRSRVSAPLLQSTKTETDVPSEP